jgi:hypothetical protein
LCNWKTLEVVNAKVTPCNLKKKRKGKNPPSVWTVENCYRTEQATNTHSQCVIRIAFSQEQCLHERTSMSRYMYIVCFSILKTFISLHIENSLIIHVPHQLTYNLSQNFKSCKTKWNHISYFLFNSIFTAKQCYIQCYFHLLCSADRYKKLIYIVHCLIWNICVVIMSLGYTMTQAVSPHPLTMET